MLIFVAYKYVIINGFLNDVNSFTNAIFYVSNYY